MILVGERAGVGVGQFFVAADGGAGAGAGEPALIFLGSEIKISFGEPAFVLGNIGGIVGSNGDFGGNGGGRRDFNKEISDPSKEGKGRGFVGGVVAATHGADIRLSNLGLTGSGNPPASAPFGLATTHGGQIGEGVGGGGGADLPLLIDILDGHFDID